MDIATTLKEIKTLSVEARIHLAQAIWYSVAAEQTFPKLTDAQKQELDRRLEAGEQNPDDVLTWEEIRADLKRG